MDIKRKSERRQKNIRKQVLEQEASGKLIEENHNGYDYSLQFTNRAVSWYLSLLYLRCKQSSPEEFGELFVRTYRIKLQTLLLHWPDSRERDWSFYFFKSLLDLYREEGPAPLWEYTEDIFRKKGFV